MQKRREWIRHAKNTAKKALWWRKCATPWRSCASPCRKGSPRSGVPSRAWSADRPRCCTPARTALGGGASGLAAAYALAVAECNACMGKIVAAPTAGACGILPGALLAVQETQGYSDEQLVDALFTAAAVGRVIARRASISGAQGGCQAECGSAAAMTAAALVELAGRARRKWPPTPARLR